MHEDVKAKLKEFGLIPVVVIKSASDALPLADALISGGLPCAEITFRTEGAEDSIRAMTKAHPNMLIGAGTVLSVEQAKRAIAAGASFIVSPGIDLAVVDYCIDQGVLVFPGCATPTDVTMAVSRSLDTVKFFPAEQLGGTSMLKAIGAPFKDVSFIPTGGISAKNVSGYLECDNVFACGGSWMVKSSFIEDGDFEHIQNLVREAVSIVKATRD